ncbi:scarecrow-like protein 6 [Oryza brachyantha]|uniref:scarecrow-like protein 6 n=1 Tax=Oryza brachyantha TaxID=4533 RepID=UPI001AD9ED01|nr:scarecrow-like protein 6 [Oryza brachyantha]
MRGMPFGGSAREGHAGTLHILQGGLGLAAAKVVSGAGAGGFWEPRSVLDHRHSPSPSPPTSASTLSSPLGAAADVAALAGANAKNVSPPPVGWPGAGGGGGGGAAGEEVANAGGKEEWVHQLTPLDMGLGAGEGWDAAGAVLSDAAAPSGLAPDNTFLRWIIGGEDASAAMAGVMDPPVLELDHGGAAPMLSPPAAAFGHNLSSFAPAMEDTKPVVSFGAHPPNNFLLHHHQQHHPQPHAAFFGAHPSFDSAPPPSKRHHPMAGAPAPKLPQFPCPLGPAGGFVPALKPKAEAANDEAAAAVEQLAEAAKLAEAGDAFGAREILARLNYRLPAAPAAGTPLLRSAFYFKEALRLALSPTGDAPASSASTPYDVVVKLGAYKAFSEVSPVLQFAHLTCVQAVLDELTGAGCIHVLDFDIGMGEQWASLMQELAQRRPATALKVTALVSPSSHHPLELQLIHENLSSFAAELGVFFQFTVFNIDTLDPAELLAIASGGDAIAVHLPVGSAHAATMPAVLRLVKRLGAKVVVSVDRGCDRSDLSFAAHLFQSLQSAFILLESIDAFGTDPDTASKIERYLLQPAIEQSVLGRHRAAMDKVAPWRSVFTSAGFVPVQATTFAESQAESLLNKVHVRGFRVEKRAGSLCLYWQRGELVSVSAWRC